MRENPKHNNPLYEGLNQERQLLKIQSNAKNAKQEAEVIEKKEAAGELINGVNASLFDLDALDG